MATKKLTDKTTSAEKFRESVTYQYLCGFIDQACAALVGRDPEVEPEPLPPALSEIVSFLDQLDGLLTTIPLEEQGAQRFGNKAFRVWNSQLADLAPDFVGRVIAHDSIPQEGWECPSLEQRQEFAEELKDYIMDSFGNATRIDYGTGHEMHFLCFLISVGLLGLYQASDITSLVVVVFNRYLALMRHIQDVYKLEPAGTRGVWGLDDYHHLPFIFGSAELMGNPIGIQPKDVQNATRVGMYAKDYMYFSCIDWIYREKLGPFHEHSNRLWDASKAADWEKVKNGMIRLFRDEVLAKWPVIQHFLFGRLLPVGGLEVSFLKPPAEITYQPDAQPPSLRDVPPQEHPGVGGAHDMPLRRPPPGVGAGPMGVPGAGPGGMVGADGLSVMGMRPGAMARPGAGPGVGVGAGGMLGADGLPITGVRPGAVPPVGTVPPPAKPAPPAAATPAPASQD